MKQIIQLLLCVGAGLTLAFVFGLHIGSSAVYTYIIGVLLAVGLYGSTYGIDLAKAREQWRLIAAAVSIGVALKSALIAVVIVLVSHHLAYAVLGVAIAQIDPLSTAAVLNNKRMSSRVKTILAAWASFDDPMTVILVVYLAPLISGNGKGGTHLLNMYGIALLENIVFVGGVFLIWQTMRRRLPKGVYALLPVSIGIAVANTWALGIAVIGLFLRPPIDKTVGYVVQTALWLATATLGVLLVGGANLLLGTTLGVTAFVAHMLVSWLLTWHLPRHERVRLALAQQNGITAIILALLLEPILPSAVAIVAPAILVTNTLHVVTNRFVETRGDDANTPVRQCADYFRSI